MTREEQMDVMENKLRQIGQQIYSTEIDAQVAKKIDDDGMKSQAAQAMAKLLKIKDAYTEILNKLKEEPDGN